MGNFLSRLGRRFSGGTTVQVAEEPSPGEGTSNEDLELVARLKAGDEAAFVELVDRYQASLIRLAMTYVANREVAEEVVQDTWIGVLQGIDRFEARSSLKTWIFRILSNRAQTRGKREARTVPFSNFETPDDDGPVTPERFAHSEDGGGHWTQPPADWRELPEESLVSSETLTVIRDAIDQLPENQKRVITLRDIEQWSAEDVRNALEITETNQRVLLHRARQKVRKALESYFESAQ